MRVAAPNWYCDQNLEMTGYTSNDLGDRAVSLHSLRYMADAGVRPVESVNPNPPRPIDQEL